VKESFKDVRLRPSFNKADVVKQELAAKDEKATAQDIVNLAISMMSLRKFTEATSLAEKALEKGRQVRRCAQRPRHDRVRKERFRNRQAAVPKIDGH